VNEEARALVRRGYDSIGARYRDWAATVASPVGRYLDRLDAALPDGAEVLDLGCGPGVPAAWLARRHRLTCVDASAVQLELARQAVPGATFVRADMTALELPAASFDAAVALFSILHVPRDEQPTLLRQIAGWLRPDGGFLATLGVSETAGMLDPDWLGAPMYASSLGQERYLELLPEVGLEPEYAAIEPQLEHGQTVGFLWVLARRRE
jgi:ubiquinone/menaquinone biosynthesis C-methylase UbiE